MLIKEVNSDLAIWFIKQYHYSKIMPRLTKHYLGVYDEKELLGIITLGWGTQPLGTIRKIFYKDNLTTKDYIEIGKMCFLPTQNNNKCFGTQVISLLVKWCKEHTQYIYIYYGRWHHGKMWLCLSSK